MRFLRLRRVNSGDTRNLAALTLSQAANAAFPLVVAPFLLHTVGAASYARFAIAEAMAMGLLTVSLYSFDLDAVGSVVGKNLDAHKGEMSAAFSEVLYARLLVFGVGALLLVGMVALIDLALLDYLWGWILYVLSQLVVSAWLYQGIQRNWITAWPIVTSRLLALAAIVWFVDAGSDAALASAIIGVASLTASFLLVCFASLRLGIRPRRVALARILLLLRRGWTVFLGCASVFFYRDANVLVLGSTLGDPSAIATYSIAEKIVKGLQAAVRPVNQLFLPKAIAALRPYSRPQRAAMTCLGALLRPQLLLVGAGMVLAYVSLAGLLLVNPALGVSLGIEQGVPLVMVMSPAVIFGVANFMLGSVGLNNLGASRYLFLSIAAIGLLNLAWCVTLTLTIGVMGAAVAFLISEAALLVLVLRPYLRGASLPPSGWLDGWYRGKL